MIYLFDLDGTLLDTEPLYDEAEQKIINLDPIFFRLNTKSL